MVSKIYYYNGQRSQWPQHIHVLFSFFFLTFFKNSFGSKHITVSGVNTLIASVTTLGSIRR